MERESLLSTRFRRIRLQLTKDASISGRLDYTSPQKLARADGSVVTGKISYTERTESTSDKPSSYNPLAGILWSVMLLVSALIFALLFPKILHRTTLLSTRAVPQALLAILVGFIAGIVVPIAIIIALITVLGVPFAIVAALAWLLILSLSTVFTAYFVGRIVWRQQSNAIIVMLIGALIVTVLLMIPILNILVSLVSIWYGSGVILLQLKRTLPAPRYELNEAQPKVKSNR